MNRLLTVLTQLNNKFIRIIFIVLWILIVTACSNFIPAQDCGDVPNVIVVGTVFDTNHEPIDNADIQIRSTNENLCPNASDFDSITFQSQVDGTFNYAIDGISEGEIITFNVSHEGYGNFSTLGTYTLFDEDIEVQLFSRN